MSQSDALPVSSHSVAPMAGERVTPPDDKEETVNVPELLNETVIVSGDNAGGGTSFGSRELENV
jgi:hypothetical protein